MSRVEALDLAVLRARLIVAVESTEVEGSPYLQAIGALFLAADPESAFEMGIWESLFYGQAQIEGVEADHLLDVLGTITAVVA